MANIRPIEEDAADERVLAVYTDIKKHFGMIPNLFKTMAHHPAYLEASWSRFKVIMTEGNLERKTKEMIAVAVSAVNNCEYCVNAHTAALKRMGMSDAELTELIAVVDLFSGFNKFLDGLRVESDLRPPLSPIPGA